jgi:hypothetical protein
MCVHGDRGPLTSRVDWVEGPFIKQGLALVKQTLFHVVQAQPGGICKVRAVVRRYKMFQIVLPPQRDGRRITPDHSRVRYFVHPYRDGKIAEQRPKRRSPNRPMIEMSRIFRVEPETTSPFGRVNLQSRRRSLASGSSRQLQRVFSSQDGLVVQRWSVVLRPPVRRVVHRRVMLQVLV